MSSRSRWPGVFEPSHRLRSVVACREEEFVGAGLATLAFLEFAYMVHKHGQSRLDKVCLFVWANVYQHGIVTGVVYINFMLSRLVEDV
jgi:hypothetical protein